ncbi:MAG: flavodoxin family protein [Candidatus Heimdallarchaeota archaeon]|nr:MAG: flavodoxin family protein [Candidatus Heimdallarchaeota archaeon]
MPFKLLGINGSPKKSVEKSNSYFLLKTALNSAKEAGAQTTLVNLTEYNFIQCNGCEVCTTKPCPLDKQDDYPKLEELILGHQGLLIASPSYWTGPPGILKNVIDRSRDNKMPEPLWAGKIFSAIAVSGLRVGGQESVINSLITFALGHGMIIVGGLGHPWFNAPFPMGTMMYDTIEEGKPKVKFRSVREDPIATKDAELLGQRLASIGSKLSS